MHVVDGDGLAAAARVDEGPAELYGRASDGGWGHAVSVGSADEELVALDVCVMDAVDVQVLADQPNGDVLDLDPGPSAGAVAR